MEARKIILGAVVLIVVALGLIFFFRARSQNKSLVLAPSVAPSLSPNLESRFNLQTSPSASKINLTPFNVEGVGAVSRDFKDGHFIQTVVVNLPEPTNNEFYETWIVRGNEGDANYSVLSLGKLTMEKGGYFLDYETSTNYSDYKKVIVTREKVKDGKMETKVLEGSFN